CISGPTERCNGCSSAHAQESSGEGISTVKRATEGGNANQREQSGDSDRTSKSRSCLCAFLQPDLRLGITYLPVPGDLLSALLRRGVRSRRDLVWSRSCDGFCV